MIAQKNETNPAIGAATGDLQGIITFSNVNSFLSTGNSFADFLAGNIKSFQQDSAQSRYYNRYTTAEPYFQDDWRITPRFTLNLGFRLSLFGTWHDKYLAEYNWEPQAFNRSLAAQAVVDPFTGGLLDAPSCLDPTAPSATTCAAIPANPTNPDPRIINGLIPCGLNSSKASCMTGHIFNPAPRVGFAWDPRGDGKMSIRAGYGVFFEHGTGDEANTGSLEGSAPLVLDMTENFTAGYECIGLGNGTQLLTWSIPAQRHRDSPKSRVAVCPAVELERAAPNFTDGGGDYCVRRKQRNSSHRRSSAKRTRSRERGAESVPAR